MNLAIYRRSDTALDAVSQFTPQSTLGRARRQLRGRMRLSGVGFLDTLFGSQTDPAPAEVYGTAPSGSGFDWNKMIETVGQVYTTVTQAEVQRDLMEMNMQRAAQGLAPLPSSQVAPQVNVGVAADTQRMILTVGLGAAVILGGAYAFGVIGKRGRRRRR